jgi:hypothetical protein
MHVANIAPQFQNVPGSFQVQATNTIQDANGAAVSGAAVTVDITLSFTDLVCLTWQITHYALHMT